MEALLQPVQAGQCPHGQKSDFLSLAQSSVFARCLVVLLGMAFVAVSETVPDPQSPTNAAVTNAAPGDGGAGALPDTAPAPDADVRAAVARGLDHLRARSSADPDGWFAPPSRQRRVVGYEDRVTMGKMVTVEIPVYEFKEQKVVRNVRDGASVDGVSVRKEVIVRVPVRQIGTRKEERWAGDPKGSVPRTHKIPVYEPGGPDIWPLHGFGHNAQALFVLLRGGVDPSDEVVMRPAENLAGLFDTFGLPDSTWDLSWIAAAFSRLAGERYRGIAARAAARLLDGQIESGPAAGLWGPVSVDTKLMAAIQSARAARSGAYLKAKDAHEVSPNRSSEKNLESAREALREVNKALTEVCMLGGADFTKIEDMVMLTDEAAVSVYVCGHPSYTYNQTAADMENTAIALFALREAAACRTLPRITPRPVIAGARLPPPRTAAGVLEKAMKALTRLQNRDGTWSECNMHQPVNDFTATGGVPGVPPKAATFAALKSPVTFTSTAQGYASLQWAASSLGATAVASVAPAARATEAVLRAPIAALMTNRFAAGEGGQATPYDALFALGVTRDGLFDATAASNLTTFLLDQQAPDGTWTDLGLSFVTGRHARDTKGARRVPRPAASGGASDTNAAAAAAPRHRINDYMITSSHRERMDELPAVYGRRTEAKATPQPTAAVNPAPAVKPAPTFMRAPTLKTASGTKTGLKGGATPVAPLRAPFDYAQAHVLIDIGNPATRGDLPKRHGLDADLLATCYALLALQGDTPPAPAPVP